MLPLSICVGSSCHLKGSYDVIEALRREVEKRHLTDQIELKAAFCLGKCAFDGVSIKVGEKIITGVTKDNATNVFEKEVIPLLK